MHDYVNTALKMPPRIKVMEALGCIADERINIISEKEAIVISSDKTREYYVYVDLELGNVYSDDNGTKIKRYVGYPIIAFLMLKNVLPYDKELAKAFSDIPWRALNEKYKSYSIVEKIVLQRIELKNIDTKTVSKFIDEVLYQLSKLKLKYYENVPRIKTSNR